MHKDEFIEQLLSKIDELQERIVYLEEREVAVCDKLLAVLSFVEEGV